jgi:hypothetical protein
MHNPLPRFPSFKLAFLGTATLNIKKRNFYLAIRHYPAPNPLPVKVLYFFLDVQQPENRDKMVCSGIYRCLFLHPETYLAAGLNTAPFQTGLFY